MALGSLLKDVEGIAKAIEHHIPKHIADDLKGLLHVLGPEVLHILIDEVSPVTRPINTAIKTAYSAIPDSPEKEKALELLRESSHLFWKAIVDGYTKPEPITEPIPEDTKEQDKNPDGEEQDRETA